MGQFLNKISIVKYICIIIVLQSLRKMTILLSIQILCELLRYEKASLIHSSIEAQCDLPPHRHIIWRTVFFSELFLTQLANLKTALNTVCSSSIIFLDARSCLWSIQCVQVIWEALSEIFYHRSLPKYPIYFFPKC